MHFLNDKVILLFAIFCFCVAAWAEEKPDKKEAVYKDALIELYGELTQGALIQGTLLQGSLLQGTEVKQLTVLDRELYINEKGGFVFGVGRDAPPELPLTVRRGDGTKHIIKLAIAQRRYNVQRIDGVDNKYVRELAEALKARTQQEATQVWRARQTLNKNRAFLQGFVWPAEGPVTGVYGSQRVFNGVPKRPHYGLDIAGPVGTPVLAPNGGEVTLAHDNMYYSGGTLILDHGMGVSSTFIHLSKIHVKVGDRVGQGQIIAEMGATGRVTGPHLDWRLNWFNQRLDPEMLLPPRPEKVDTGIK